MTLLRLSLHPACYKANLRTKLILKSFLSHGVHSLTHAFTTFVRPILEYATPVWCPHFKCDIDLIEEVQSTFTRKLYFLCNLTPVSYNDRLSFLGIQRPELRRILNDLCFMFELTHGDWLSTSTRCTLCTAHWHQGSTL